MQRRATAVTTGFFLVIALIAYLLVGVAEGRAPERVNGFWGVAILSSVSAMLILMLSFLPSRY